MSDAEPTNDDVDDQFSAAVEEFRADLSAAIDSPVLENRIVECYQAYTGVFADAIQSPAVTRLASERHGPYAKAVAEAFSSERARLAIRSAYERYVTAMKEAWHTMDDQPDPADLASIAEEMQWVAGVVAAVEAASEPGR